jgi:chlorophyll synthase
MTGAFPDLRVVTLAGLYSFGAIGIMIFNDFKAVEGDRQMAILSVPVDLGVESAAWLACIIMAAPQVIVATLLVSWGQPFHAAAIALSLALQCGLMVRLLGDPRKFAPWFNATGTLLYVLGMLVSAFAVGAHPGGLQ